MPVTIIYYFSHMFAKLLAFILLLVVSYTLSIFAIPEIVDQYGNKDFNTKVRDIKEKSLHFASGSDSASSIADKILDVSKWIATEAQGKIASGAEITNTVIDTSKVLIDEGKQTLENTEQILTEKTEQAKKAAESAQKAYEAVDQAKQDFKNLTNFSGSVQ